MPSAFLDSKMEKRKKGVFGPSAGKEYLIFVDDFNMPQREEYGAQPPVELIRQAIGQEGWYDTKTLEFRKIIDCTYIMAMGPPGGGRNPITERVKRLCNVIGYVEMEESSQKIIFNAILGHFLDKFEKDVAKQASAGGTRGDCKLCSRTVGSTDSNNYFSL